MALKLGKCRLCLKLGDFYSIFTVDNAIQLSEMVMECTRIKVYEGDGLPDKVCSECIQKLSSAYIFKQQCERADQELRRNYVPPPGFSVSPPPPNRQSSDSAFSTLTDSSNLKSSFNETKITPVSSSRKRSVESDGISAGSRSEYKPSSSKRVEELRRLQKRPRYAPSQDSDYEDNGASSYVPETDSDEPLLTPNTHNCTMCPKTFKWLKSLKAHMANVHTKTSPNKDFLDRSDNSVSTPQTPTENEKINCEKCGKSFKLQIMLKCHMETCGTSPVKCFSPKKELLISLEPIDGMTASKKVCEYCNARFKTVDNLEKHLRVVHAAALKRESLEPKKNIIVTPKAKSTPNDPTMTSNIPCIYCKEQYDDYYVYTAHIASCSLKDSRTSFNCPLCQRELTKKTAFLSHLRSTHFEQVQPARKSTNSTYYEEFECRMCSKKLASQDLLITHLAAHMSNIEHDDNGAGDDSRPSTVEDSESVYSAHSSQVSGTPNIVKCRYCDKEFKYKKSLISHEEKHREDGTDVKQEPPDKPDDEGLLEETGADMDRDFESDSSQDDGEDTNECDICEKHFSYKRLLIQHKKTKHNQCSGTKRAKINLKDCTVKCLICDVDMKVSDINEHNQTHIAKNMKPRNIYTCTFTNCNQKFKSCSNLANHIKLVHRLNQQQVPKKYIGANMADFCEVVVTKAEPLDNAVQSRNGFVEVPSKTGPHINLSGFSCHVCGKKMPTLISLKRHVNWHTNVGDNIQKQYECFVCKESFRFQCHYKLHMRQHYHDTNLDPKLLTCTICNRKSKHLRAAQAHMNFHKQTRFQTKDYQCSICKRVFQYRKVYLSHMAIHYKKGESANNTVVGDVATRASIAASVVEGANSCHLCGKLCDSETSLKHHLIWHKSKTLLFGARHECTICQLQFTNKRHLELHTRSHYESDDGPFKCTVCGKGYTDEDYMKRHQKGHNFDHQSHKARIEKLRKGKVKCPICSRFYPDVVKLIRHLRRTHPESKMIKEDPDAPPPAYFSCKLCAKTFLDERRLKKHEEAHLRKPCFFKCKFCGKKTISLKMHHLHIKGHLTTKHTDKPLRCSQCEATFVLGYALHHHLRDVHGIKETWIADRTDEPEGPLQELQCSICLKVLASKGNYERHIDYHNSLRCNYCFDYFGSLRFLEGHLAFGCDKRKLIGDTDSYPKKVKCELCYKAFSVQVKLDCHLRTAHEVKVTRERSEGKAEIVCDYCFKVFENEYALSTHKIYHRTIGYFGCIYCPRKFNTQQAFRRHKTCHLYQLNNDDPTKCEHCDETFVAFRDMIDHMRDAHNDDKDWIVMPKDSIEEVCPICNKKFFNLHRHLDYHEENRCKKCSEYFYSTAECDAHLCAIVSDDEDGGGEAETTRAPTEDCAFCFKPITKRNSKKMHDNLHHISGAISCRFCPLKFKTIDAFNIHAFSHRSRKYVKKPIKCRICKEKFVKYGPFMKHMKNLHKSTKRVHYRAFVKPERCVVCGGEFPNLHNHYRNHLVNRCKSCLKYFTSTRLFERHKCDEADRDPDRVFTSDENLQQLINTYVPKDLKDDEKFYGYTDDEEEEEESVPVPELVPKPRKTYTRRKPPPAPTPSLMTEDERNLHNMVTSPIISDVLSLYQKADGVDLDSKTQNGDFGEVVDLSDDSLGVNDLPTVVVVIDDDD